MNGNGRFLARFEHSDFGNRIAYRVWRAPRFSQFAGMRYGRFLRMTALRKEPAVALFGRKYTYLLQTSGN
jgi:hypothetical protein